MTKESGLASNKTSLVTSIRQPRPATVAYQVLSVSDLQIIGFNQAGRGNRDSVTIGGGGGGTTGRLAGAGASTATAHCCIFASCLSPPASIAAARSRCNSAFRRVNHSAI